MKSLNPVFKSMFHKIALCLLGIGFFSTALAQIAPRAPFDLYQVSHVYAWNPVTSAWDTVSKSLLSYDQAGRLSDRESFTYNGSWSPALKEQSAYSLNGDTSAFTTSLWVGGAWVPHERRTIAKDSAGFTVFELLSNWAGSGWEASSGTQTVIQRNGSGQVSSRTMSKYVTFPVPAWLLDAKIDYRYAGGTLPDSAIFYGHDGSNWTALERWSNISWHDLEADEVSFRLVEFWADTAFAFSERMTCALWPTWCAPLHNRQLDTSGLCPLFPGAAFMGR
jgi:hypothetical protein